MADLPGIMSDHFFKNIVPGEVSWYGRESVEYIPHVRCKKPFHQSGKF